MWQQTVHIPIKNLKLEGKLAIPDKTSGIVLFVHGSGSSRKSPRNNFVAQVLWQKGLGTLLFDLLTEDENEVYETRFNIDLLTQRLITTTQWLQEQSQTKGLSSGYFGASTGAAAALNAAASLRDTIKAVVSRGGRPDLASTESLKQVSAPALLIVGGNDLEVLELNQEVYEQIQTKKELKVIPGATHLFEEPGALDEVARLAAEWFDKYLSK